MSKYIKYPLYSVGAIVAIIVLGMAYLSIAFPRVGPAPEMNIEITPERVERGKYLSHHVMVCSDCHSRRDFSIYSGPPTSGTEFVGGDIFDQSMGFPGRFVSANITPYGIGDWTDGEIFRLITTGVTREGRPIFPVMPYHSYGKLDPEDIKSVIAYLRTLEPVAEEQPVSKADFPFNMILKTMPVEAEMAPRPEKGDRIAYGKYVVTAAGCMDCHTKFEGGAYVGPKGGGGREFAFPDGSVVRSANLTPHVTGVGKYTRESFIARFKLYADSSHRHMPVTPGKMQTLMPWVMYSGMEEEDLGAIYDYLQTLEPYDHAVTLFSPADNAKLE